MKALNAEGLARLAAASNPAEDHNRLADNASTISGFSHEYDIKRLTQATKALSSNPSMYKQTKYLDEIEEILKKRKRSK